MRELWRAAFVIARRDFSAVVLSRTFILFLLGPLLPILIGFAFGGLGERISSTDLRPIVGLYTGFTIDVDLPAVPDTLVILRACNGFAPSYPHTTPSSIVGESQAVPVVTASPFAEAVVTG